MVVSPPKIGYFVSLIKKDDTKKVLCRPSKNWISNVDSSFYHNLIHSRVSAELKRSFLVIVKNFVVVII